MKIFQTKIIGSRIECSNPLIEEKFYIDVHFQTNEIYVWSENGHHTFGIIDFKGDLIKALQYTKNTMKTYFLDRGMDNPIGF